MCVLPFSGECDKSRGWSLVCQLWLGRQSIESMGFGEGMDFRGYSAIESTLKAAIFSSGTDPCCSEISFNSDIFFKPHLDVGKALGFL